MSIFSSIVIGIIGFIIAFLLDFIPMDIFLKIIPNCWNSEADCAAWYCTIKTYIIIFLMALIIWFIPFF